jgi:hypothetical protein
MRFSASSASGSDPVGGAFEIRNPKQGPKPEVRSLVAANWRSPEPVHRFGIAIPPISGPEFFLNKSRAGVR